MTKDFYEKDTRKHMMLIDGNSLINRAYYAGANRAMLTAPDGTPSGAVYTFLNMLLNYQAKIQPDNMVVAFDLKDKTFRHDMYDEYKSTRTGMPEDLAIQMPLLKELLDALNVCRVEMSGYEADDLIGSYAYQAEEEGYDVYIVTGDKDSYQLVSDNIMVVLPVTRSGSTSENLVDRAAFVKEFKFQPEQFADYKAIMGDSSDNIPGVKGIGKVGASELIENYNNLKNIYRLLEEEPDIIPKKYQKKLLAEKEMAFLSYDLVLIKKDIPLEVPVQDTIKKNFDEEALTAFFNKMGFQSMFDRFDLKGNASLFDQDFILKEASGLEKFLKNLKSDPMVWLVLDDGRSFLYDFKGSYLLLEVMETQMSWDLLSNLDSPMVVWDYKTWIKSLKLGHLKNNPFDIQMAAYLLNQGKAEDFTSVFQTVFGENLPGLNKKYTEQELIAFVKKMAYAMSHMYKIQKKELSDYDMDFLFYEIEVPLTKVLADMEILGVSADKEKLDHLNKNMNEAISKLEEEIFSYAKEPFNVNSSQQLSDVLFNQLGLKAGKKLASGYYSTAASELERLQGVHPIIDLIIDHRELSKLNSTFVDGLRKSINKKDNRIHTTYHQTLTSTGRLSSSNPNLQNIPIRSDRSKLIREVFIAKPGYLLLGADYSQIELRLLAHLSGDSDLIDAFNHNIDIHANTAMKIFNKEADEISKSERSLAKTVNFSIVYGVSAFGLSKDLKSSVPEAKTYIDTYYATYKKVKPYLDSSIEMAKERGYVETLFHRRRYIPELSSKQFFTKSFGERAAMNAPLQGTAADIIKLAMVKLDQELKKNKLKARIILQVHDELILEVPEKEIDQVKKILEEEMKNVVQLKVPLEVEAVAGKSWADI